MTLETFKKQQQSCPNSLIFETLNLFFCSRRIKYGIDAINRVIECMKAKNDPKYAGPVCLVDLKK